MLTLFLASLFIGPFLWIEALIGYLTRGDILGFLWNLIAGILGIGIGTWY